jgi:hypothetical protein
MATTLHSLRHGFGGGRSSRPSLEFLEDRTLLSSTWIVSNINDSGLGSLRTEIKDAGSGDTIAFASGVSGTITLANGTLNINKNLDIEGPGAGVLTIGSGGNSGGVFNVDPDLTATIAGLTIAGGDFDGGHGGGILNDGTLTVSDCTISGNSADVGGAISNDGASDTVFTILPKAKSIKPS